MIAHAKVLGEFEAAKIEKREVSIDQALDGMLSDPFGWEDTAANRVFVIWRAGQQFNCDMVTLRHLLKGMSGDTP